MKPKRLSTKFFSMAVPALFLSILFSLVFFTGTVQADRSFDMQQVSVQGELAAGCLHEGNGKLHH